jgi:hypothetical protein
MNVEIGTDIPFLGIFVSKFWYFVFAVFFIQSRKKCKNPCIRKEGKGTNPAQISVPLTPKDTNYMTYRLRSLYVLFIHDLQEKEEAALEM